MKESLVYHGRYSQELRKFFDDVLSHKNKNNRPDIDYISSKTSEISYDQLKNMFPDLEEIGEGTWSRYNIVAEENDRYVLEISLFRETLERIHEIQDWYPEETVSDEYYMAFFVGGSVSQNIGGDLYTDHSFVVALDNKIVRIKGIF